MSTARHFIDHHAQTRPRDIFLIAPQSGLRLDYKTLQRHCEDITARLCAMGIAEGEKVAFLLPNGYWAAVLFLGVMYGGRVIVPLNAVAGNAALDYVIGHSDSRVIFADAALGAKFAEVIRPLPDAIEVIHTDAKEGPAWPRRAAVPVAAGGQARQMDEDEAAVLIYTSGTTGKPKGVLLSHKNAVAGGRNTMLAHALTERDRALCVLPLYHINGEMVTIMGPLVSGGGLVIPPRFQCSTFWSLMAAYQCTWFSVVPTIIAYLLEDAERNGIDRDTLDGLDHTRFGRSASSALAPETHKAFERRFRIPIIETMGLTETAAPILSNPMPPAKPRYGSPGKPVGNEVKVIDPAGNECPPGAAGELLVRGDNVTKAYYKNEQATRDAFDADGWFRTGDIATRDADGFYFVTGRIKELIIKGGENIAPREVDEALYRHPAVLEAAAFGYPDKHYGQEVMAAVALKPGLQCAERELKALTKSALGEFKAPRRILFMDELPKGPSGKIQRLKLAQLAGDGL